MSKIQSVAVAGHGTCGKTTLVEKLLAHYKAIPKAGSVDEGTSVLDHDAEEKERKFTIEASTGRIETKEGVLQLIDTPGYPDFLGAVVDSYSVVENALIAVDAVDGIRVNTRRCWDEAGKLGLARMVVVTRMDSEKANFKERLEEIRETFGTECHAIYLPDSSGPAFSKLQPLLFEEGTSSLAKTLHDELLESIVEADEDLMERYLEGEEIKPEEIESVFTSALLSGSVVPVFCCSATQGIGLTELVETIQHVAPEAETSIKRRVEDLHGEELPDQRPNDSAESPFLAQVFKVVSDDFVGKLSYMRVFAGTATANTAVVNLTSDDKERLSTLLFMNGKEQSQAETVRPGDIFAVPKLESLQIGDSVGASGVERRVALVRHPRSMVKLAIEPKNRNDETKLTESLNKLAETDSTFSVDRNPQTHELVISGRSALHLETMLHKLKRRFKIDVDTKVPKTSYLESIQTNAEGHHRHKKQTGGRGQFGEVYLKIEPGEKGQGLEFVDQIVGGVIPSGFLPAIEKGIREAMTSGILAGCPIVDVRVIVYDGSYHNVDSSEAAFKTAGREAFKKAFLAAKPCLLEPIVNMEVSVPSAFLGDIMSDLNSRRAHIGGMDAFGDTQVIKAQVPEAEIKRYSIDLRSITGGEGSYSVEFSHYDTVPPHAQAEVIKENQAEAKESA